MVENSKEEEKPLIFLITSDKCAHCRNIERELKGFPEAIAEAGFEASYAFANCDRSKVCAALNVNRMPRLFVIKGNYDDRTRIDTEPKKELLKVDVIRHLNANVAIPVASSVSQVKDIVKHTEVMTFAAFYDPTTEEGQAVKKQFGFQAEQAGGQYYRQRATLRWLTVEVPDGNFDDANAAFGVNENKAVRLLPKSYESKYEEAVLDIPAGNDTATVLTGLGGDLLSDWWIDKIIPLVGRYGYYTEFHYRYIQKTHIRIFSNEVDTYNPRKTAFFTNKIRKVARMKKYEKFIFSVENLSQSRTATLKHYQLDALVDFDQPLMMIDDSHRQYKIGVKDPVEDDRLSDDVYFRLPQEEITIASMEAFIDEFQNEALIPYQVSAESGKAEQEQDEMRSKKDEGLVTVLGNTFNDIVLDTSKDCALMIIHANSGKSKAINGEWAAVAKHFENEHDLVIGVLDYKSNKFSHRTLLKDLKTVPALVFFPWHDKKFIVQYDGEQNGFVKDEMIKFIEDNSEMLDTGEEGEGGEEDIKFEF